MLLITHFLISWGLIFGPLLYLVSFERQFSIDYRNNCFLKDAEPLRFISRSVHYFLVQWQYWADHLAKVMAAGLNTLRTYMLHGGTAFGFRAGFNMRAKLQTCPTSYDYDAPLNEAEEDRTSKFYAIRQTMEQFVPLPPGPVPVSKMKLMPITMQKSIDIFEYLQLWNENIVSLYPLSFEDIRQPSGFVMYSATVNFTTNDPVLLTVFDIRDRGHVFVNKEFRGILSREQKIYSMSLSVKNGQELSILVENQGRVSFGAGVKNLMGIISNVTLGSQILVNWTMQRVILNSQTSKILEVMTIGQERQYVPSNLISSAPAFYIGTFPLEIYEPQDTFLRLDGWHKGVAFLNGFNLGRYWPIVGPQITLYVPGFLLKKTPELNNIVVLELEYAPCKNSLQCVVTFVDLPVANGTIPLVKRCA